MDLSIITVTWNSEDTIADQIRSVISACQDLDYEHFVVDNNSSDKTVELVKSNFSQINLIENSKNKGFAAANNQAFARVKGQFILFLNPDMKLSSASLSKLLEWIRPKKEVAIASVKLESKDDSANPRSFPTLWSQLWTVTKLGRLFPVLLNDYLMKDFDENKEQEVDSVRGSFMLVRKSFLDSLGFAFDPRYFIWFEDVDLCHEARKRNLKVVYTPIISATDLVGQSFKKQPGVWAQKKFTNSMTKYFEKWHPGWRAWILKLVSPVGVFLVRLKVIFSNE